MMVKYTSAQLVWDGQKRVSPKCLLLRFNIPIDAANNLEVGAY